MAKVRPTFDWEKEGNPDPLLNYFSRDIERAARDEFKRKARLFGCACCRRVRDHFPFEQLHNEIDLAEAFAETRTPIKELRQAQEGDGTIEIGITTELVGWLAWNAVSRSLDPDAITAARGAAIYSARAVESAEPREESQREAFYRERSVQADLFRDVFGNPVLDLNLDPSWRSTTAVSIARAVYDERRFEDLPILADALEDAGCTSEEIIAHCRSTGPHVRGCWVVDWLIGRPFP
jgi:hypothetical protein